MLKPSSVVCPAVPASNHQNLTNILPSMWITATQRVFHKTSDLTIYNIVKLRVEVKSAISLKIVLSVLFYCYSDKRTPSELASLRAGLRLDAWPVEPVHKTFGNV